LDRDGSCLLELVGVQNAVPAHTVPLRSEERAALKHPCRWLEKSECR
jgi:hypothetical protein